MHEREFIRLARKVLSNTWLEKPAARWYRKARLLLIGRERLFSRTFNAESAWGKESLSGRGSDTDQTRVIVEELPKLFAQLEVKTILDIPCGDHFWFKDIPLSPEQSYTGGDIIQETVQANNEQHGSKLRTFIHFDLLTDEIMAADLLLVRDCFIHFSNADTWRALENIAKSNCRFLCTTTYINRSENSDITTGQFRPLNLTKPPFSLPDPAHSILEHTTQGNGLYADKSLGVWPIEAIKQAITRRQNASAVKAS